jgi:hypothetical protein
MSFKNLLFPALLMLASIAATSQDFFPDRCLGQWQGTMHIYFAGQLRDSVSVRFTVAPIDSVSWTWRMEYLSDKLPMTKDYVLRIKDKQRQVYVTDEGDGIELQDYLFGNKLYSVFETGGILLTASYEWRGDELIFEVTSGKKADSAAAEVQSHPVSSVQRAVLRRI